MKALLIDDEAHARADLRTHLGAHPGVAIVAEAATLRSARALLAGADYDVVFLDVQLIGGESFELVPDVRPGARVIFVTGHDRYALRAFEVNALDYLLKPIDAERLAESLRRLAAAQPETGDGEAGPPSLPLRPDDAVYLRSGLRARFAAVADISLIVAAENYSEVTLADGSRVFLRRSLKAWEEMLPATHFMRVHRTQIVNLTRVVRYERDGDEHTRVFVTGVDGAVLASRRLWSDVRERLEALRVPQSPAPGSPDLAQGFY
jgi:two-component system LytT family response regulator